MDRLDTIYINKKKIPNTIAKKKDIPGRKLFSDFFIRPDVEKIKDRTNNIRITDISTIGLNPMFVPLSIIIIKRIIERSILYNEISPIQECFFINS